MATDFEALRAMTDDEIDCSDVPEMTEEFLRDAEIIVGLPGSEHLYFAIDGATFRYFKNTGKGYLNRLNMLVNKLLREYVRQQTSQEVI